jgi:hypothetical protein
MWPWRSVATCVRKAPDFWTDVRYTEEVNMKKLGFIRPTLRSLAFCLCAIMALCQASSRAEAQTEPQPVSAGLFRGDTLYSVILTREFGVGPFNPGDTMVVTVIQQGDGSYLAQASRMALVANGTESCIQAEPEVCLLPALSAPVVLDVTQVDTLRALVAAVPPPDFRVPPDLTCDPQYVSTITVNGVSVEGTFCGEPQQPAFTPAYLALLGFLDALVPAEPAEATTAE